MKNLLQFNLYLAYYALLALLPLGWISLLDLGSLSLKVMHLALIPLLIAVLFPSFRNSLKRFIYENRYLLCFFILLMVMNFVSLTLNAITNPNALAYIVKNLSYCGLFLLFGALMIEIAGSPNFHKHITLSNTAGIIMFISIAIISFNTMGRSFIDDLLDFFLRGDSDALRYSLFRTLFNASEELDDIEQSTNLLNTLLGSFIFINFTSLYAWHNTKGKLMNVLNIFCIGFSFFIIIAGLSRSNIFALVLGYLMYWISDIVLNNNQRRFLHIGIFVILGTLFSLLFWTKIESSLSDASTMIAGRFSDLAENPRWAINAACVNSFTANTHNFLIGKGPAAMALYDNTAHNFILGAAFQAGIIALILSCLYYFGLIFYVYKNVFVLANHKNALLIGSLMIIPLLRAMESGGAGSFTLQEWFCIAFFQGFVLVKRDREQTQVIHS